MEHMKNDYKINRPQNQSDVSEPLAQVSMQQLVKNPIVTHVGLIPMACLNCPYLQIELGCNQCNRSYRNPRRSSQYV
nr:MAG TPA: 33 kDa chaperonin [Bacteriophage sp.]DAZ75739.1 MAG TPA: 33 kDa chaperonin [Caudoviricetes sp.]